MLQPKYAKQFKRDLKLQKKRGKDISKIKTVLEKLIAEKPLSSEYQDHILIGNFKSRRECHIETNWLLIYQIHPTSIYFERTGTHSDLFD